MQNARMLIETFPHPTRPRVFSTSLYSWFLISIATRPGPQWFIYKPIKINIQTKHTNQSGSYTPPTMESPPALRLAVLRLHDLQTCIAKAPISAVVLPLRFNQALSEPQLRILALATPFIPVMITVRVSDKWTDNAFPAEIITVESPPRVPNFKRLRKIRTGLAVRKRGGVMMPE
jgi:hypothetical protein